MDAITLYKFLSPIPTVTTVWITGETGDIHPSLPLNFFLCSLFKFDISIPCEKGDRFNDYQVFGLFINYITKRLMGSFMNDVTQRRERGKSIFDTNSKIISPWAIVGEGLFMPQGIIGGHIVCPKKTIQFYPLQAKQVGRQQI